MDTEWMRMATACMDRHMGMAAMLQWAAEVPNKWINMQEECMPRVNTKWAIRKCSVVPVLVIFLCRHLTSLFGSPMMEHGDPGYPPPPGLDPYGGQPGYPEGGWGGQ